MFYVILYDYIIPFLLFTFYLLEKFPLMKRKRKFLAIKLWIFLSLN